LQYTVKQLADLAGVSTQTLRYYDQIGLLKPAGTTEAGYRLYSSAEVDRLQQILFYREIGMSLEQIGEIISAPDFDLSRLCFPTALTFCRKEPSLINCSGQWSALSLG